MKLLLTLVLISNPLHSRITFGSQHSAIEIGANGGVNIGAYGIEIAGSIIKHQNGTLSGGPLNFQNGIFKEAGAELTLNAQYNISSAEIELSGGTALNPKVLRAEPGKVLPQIKIQNTYNKIEGQPTFNSPILFDSNATLTLNIQNQLNQNITFSNNNILYLEDNLGFADNVTLDGNGTVKLNGRQLSFGGKEITMTGSLYLDNATDISLNSKTNLSGIWTFSAISNLNGNGNILDLNNTGTGIIVIEPNSKLYLTNIVVKGISSNSFVFSNKTSQLFLSNVTFEMTNNYTMTTGGIYAEGPITFMLKNNDWTFDTNASLTIDGTTIWIDSLDAASSGNILFGTPKANHLSLIKSGTIKEVVTGGGMSLVPDWVEETSDALNYWADYVESNSEWIVSIGEDTAELAVDNSEAIVGGGASSDLAIDNSEWIVNIGEALIEPIIDNSYAIVALDDLAIDNSNAINYLSTVDIDILSRLRKLEYYVDHPNLLWPQPELETPPTYLVRKPSLQEKITEVEPTTSEKTLFCKDATLHFQKDTDLGTICCLGKTNKITIDTSLTIHEGLGILNNGTLTFEFVDNYDTIPTLSFGPQAQIIIQNKDAIQFAGLGQIIWNEEQKKTCSTSDHNQQ